jgi:hypothetical protein
LWGFISCEEGWVRREPVASPHRILGQSHDGALRATAAGGIDVGGVFEFESTKNVAFHGKEKHKDGGDGCCEGFLKRHFLPSYASLGWRGERRLA